MKLSKIYIMLGMALLLGSCKSDEPVEPQSGGVEVPVSFTIQLANETGGTRSEAPNGSVWDEKEGETNEGLKEFDNDIKTVKPVIYKVGDGGKLETTPIAMMSVQTKKEQGANHSNVWVISGVMKCRYDVTENDLISNSYRLALFINCNDGDVKNPLSAANPEDAIFYHHGIPGQNLDGADLSEPFESIPMYGVTPIMFTQKEGKLTATAIGGGDISVNVLRSMAKVRVLLGPALQGRVQLTNLSISRHAIKGYVCPKKWDTAENFAEVASSVYMRGLTGSGNFYSDPCITDITTIYHKGTGGNSVNKIGFYLPDTYNYKHDDQTSEEIKLTISYDIYENGSKVAHHDNPMWFRPVSTWNDRAASDPWDIIRNHIYEFVITGVERTTGALIVDVAIKPWVKHEFTEWYEAIPDPAN